MGSHQIPWFQSPPTRPWTSHEPGEKFLEIRAPWETPLPPSLVWFTQAEPLWITYLDGSIGKFQGTWKNVGEHMEKTWGDMWKFGKISEIYRNIRDKCGRTLFQSIGVYIQNHGRNRSQVHESARWGFPTGSINFDGNALAIFDGSHGIIMGSYGFCLKMGYTPNYSHLVGIICPIIAILSWDHMG